MAASVIVINVSCLHFLKRVYGTDEMTVVVNRTLANKKQQNYTLHLK